MSHAFATPRPRLSGLDALTTLRDFAMVTYDVDPTRLAELLPKGYGLEPDLVTLRDGRRRGLVSAVNFRDIDFRFVGAGRVRVSFVQTNYRAYVTRGSERSVWFFGTTLGSRLSACPRLMWGMPWYGVKASLDSAWKDDRCVRYESVSRGNWGSCELHLEGTNQTSLVLDGFTDIEEGARVITHPLIGYFGHRRGGVGRYAVWHEPLQPTMGRAISVRFSPFEDRGLVAEGQTPHSVLLQRSTDFAVLLPPTRLARAGSDT